MDIRLIQLVDRAHNGVYDLPELQREFKWKPEQVRYFCDSLYKGYPVGMLLFWSNPLYIQPRRGAPSWRIPSWILDGQQRIVTLCLIFDKKPIWYSPEEWAELKEKNPVFANIDIETGKVEFSGKRKEISFAIQEILSSKDIIQLVELANRESKGDVDKFSKILGPLQQIWNWRNTLIPIVELSDLSPADAAEIFSRMNSSGTKVKETDIRFALIAAYNPGWRREKADPYFVELENKGWGIEPGRILQALTIYQKGIARVEELPISFWKEEITTIWDNFTESVDEVLTYLWDRGIPFLDLIPSEYTLIPLFALHARFKDTPDYSFDLTFRWFIWANQEGRYSGAPLETLTKDGKVIYQANSLNDALLKLSPDKLPSRSDFERLFREPFRKGSFQALLLHIMLWQKDVRDWLNPVGIRAISLQNGTLKPNWHHILPLSYAERYGYKSANSTANITILCESTNIRRLKGKPPWIYVPRNRISQEVLEEHFIPPQFASKFITAAQLTPEEFLNFIHERSKLLADEAIYFFKPLCDLYSSLKT